MPFWTASGTGGKRKKLHFFFKGFILGSKQKEIHLRSFPLYVSPQSLQLLCSLAAVGSICWQGLFKQEQNLCPLQIEVLQPTITIFVWELVLNLQVRPYLVVCNLLQIENMLLRRERVFSQVLFAFIFSLLVIPFLPCTTLVLGREIECLK